MKKRVLSMLLALVMLLGLLPTGVLAADDVTVYVTVVQGGTFAATKDGGQMAQKPVTVNEQDGEDGLTLNDAMICAHRDYHTDGADGYSGGGFVSKLWGASGNMCGFYKNDGLTAAVNQENVTDGDYITAFAYQDESGYSDQYGWFEDQPVASLAVGEELALTMKMAGYDASWSMVTQSAAGMTLTVDGQETESVTDENGQASLRFAQEGTYVVSAKAPAGTYLVPPACTVTVIAGMSEEE